jgi:hypothetical protein
MSTTDTQHTDTQDTSKKADPLHLTKGERFDVFTIREGRNGAVWLRTGSAWANRDGSINVQLDALPLDGRLHIRRPIPRLVEKPDTDAN